MSALFENFGYFWLVMERRIVHDHQALWPEHGQQHFPDPCGHGDVGTAFAERHGRNPVLAPLRHDEIGSLALIASYFAEDLLAPGRPAMGTMHAGLKAALIKINHILPAMFGDPAPQLPEKCDPLFATTLSIPRRFF